jgi:hypothetical protein
MISLKELLHAIDQENKDGLVCLDDWRWPDMDHLVSMGFDFADDFRLHTTREPKITIYKKKEGDSKDGEKSEENEYFYVEEAKRATKRFKSFGDIVDYFDSYEQPALDKNM